MKKLFLLSALLLSFIAAQAQQSNSIILHQPVDDLPVKQLVTNPRINAGPQNSRIAHKGTAGYTTYTDWYDLWDEMFDTTSVGGPHSYQYLWEVYPDSNIFNLYGYYPPYYTFTHGIGMSFDPSDSAYFYHAVNPSYMVSAPFDFRQPYQLDSFWVPGQYMRYNPSPTIVDSLIVEFLVTQNGSLPDSGAYALITTAPAAMYAPCTADSTPRFATPRYFRAQNECIDPVLTTTSHQRYAFPLTPADAGIYKTTKFGLTTPLVVPPHKYLAAYVYFKSQVAYPVGTNSFTANYYWMYAGEPYGMYNWFPQSARTPSTGYPGSHQDGLIATKQIRYNDLGFTFNGHNVLLPSYAYASSGTPPGFDVPHMAFHITWVQPPPLVGSVVVNEGVSVNTFPNPASDVLNTVFALPQAENVKISLINTVGQVVDTRDMGYTSSGRAMINISALPQGLYTCLFEAAGVRQVHRVIIAH